jgi:hypothetical protein
MTVNTMKEHHEEGTSQELEAGGNGEMCQHAQIILTWSDGYILDYDQANQLLKEAWEHDNSKDELKETYTSSSPAPMTPLCADPSPAHVSPGKL